MSDTVRQLTQQGIDAFRDYIEAVRRGEKPDDPSRMLYQSPHSESINQLINIDREQFYTKHEAAVYFSRVFDGLDKNEIAYNRGLWSWLSLYYIDELKKSGQLKLNVPDFYILGTDGNCLTWKYTYHLLALPFYLYQQHGDTTKPLLSVAVSFSNKIIHQIVSRQQFSNSLEFIKLVVRLYGNRQGGMKTGVVTWGKPGTVFRLINVFQQLELTYDIFNMPYEEMIKLLPAEFDRWLNPESA